MKRLVDIVGNSRTRTTRPCVPSGLAVFAVGDLHGRLDLLVDIHRDILERAKDIPAQTRKVIVYLGDYVDRGPDSAGVIDALVAAPLVGFKSVHLMGNHELAFSRFIRGERDYLHHISGWLYEFGGIETLKSYGVDVSGAPTPENIAAMRVQLLRKMPTDHFQFLESLALNHCVGDYFFVHAGIDPKRSLNEQRPSDMLNIREPFLHSKTIYDKIIVHGHTPFKAPNIQTNRIGLDTEAYQSGALSGLMLLRDQITVFQTKSV